MAHVTSYNNFQFDWVLQLSSKSTGVVQPLSLHMCIFFHSISLLITCGTPSLSLNERAFRFLDAMNGCGGGKAKNTVNSLAESMFNNLYGLTSERSCVNTVATSVTVRMMMMLTGVVPFPFISGILVSQQRSLGTTQFSVFFFLMHVYTLAIFLNYFCPTIATYTAGMSWYDDVLSGIIMQCCLKTF